MEISKVSSSHYDTLTQHAITAVCTLQEYAGAKRIQPSPAPQPPQRGHRDLAPHATLRPSPTLREPIGFLPLFSLADWSSSLPLRKLIGPPLRPSNRRGAMLSVAARFPPRGGHVSRSAVRAVRTVGGWRSSALTDPVLGAISRYNADPADCRIGAGTRQGLIIPTLQLEPEKRAWVQSQPKRN